ncbi:MAG: glycosyltransferase family 39 protein, partial [Anaerolineae bacterium]
MTASEAAAAIPRTARDRRQRLLVAVVTLGALALRLIHLGRDSLWYDETVSVTLAGQRTAELIGHTARDIHPPLYYLLLRGWLLLAGYPTGQAGPTGHGLEFMAAFLSLLFGVLLVPLTWQLARRLGLRHPVPLLSALLVAISPFGVWYSQEVRMYTLGATLGVLVLLATLPFLRRDASPARLRRAALV